MYTTVKTLLKLKMSYIFNYGNDLEKFKLQPFIKKKLV